MNVEISLEFLVQFTHPGKSIAGWLRANEVEPEIATAFPGLFGVTPEAWTEQQAIFSARTREAALELLADETARSAFEQLPLVDGDVVLALGDSITDDLQSWFEILRAMVAEARPDAGIQLVNAGVSGARSTDILASAPLLTAVRPTVVFIMIGTNDAARVGPIEKPMVSDLESDANLRALRELLGRQPNTRQAYWLTPPPPHAALLATDELIASAQISIPYEQVARKAELIRRLPDPTVDLLAAFGTLPAADLYLPDGVHPNLDGQKLILRTVLTTLATS